MAHQIEGMATQVNPRYTSVIYEVEMTAQQAALRSRNAHFKIGNEALLNATDSSPQFRGIIESLVPGFEKVRGVKVAATGKSPAEFVTWHHVPGTNRLQLVWRFEHELGNPFAPVGSPWRNLFHPDGSGGFSNAAQ